jgi:hypothetical protein
MRVIRFKDRGDDVQKWQLFLHGQGYLFKTARDGVFGKETLARTKEFQKASKLKDDGVVGNATYGKAMLLGFEAVDFTREPEAHFPAEPDFDPIVGNTARQAIFGPLNYRKGGSGFGKESLICTNDFVQRKIRKVIIPQLIGIKGGPASGAVSCHTLAADQLQGLWAALGKLNLLKRVVSWEGCLAMRFIRCSTTTLSNHAFGTAFDINAATNGLGAQPALPGRPGCLYEIVPVAHKFGFYWGGHFASRRDGMHFELAKMLSASEVAKILAKI